MITKLYKRSKNNKVQEWAIEVRKDRFRTFEGFVGGTITQSKWTVCKGKNLGTKKETTNIEQAQKEADAKILKLKKKDWTENIEGIDNAKRKVLPMLAKKFEDEFDKLMQGPIRKIAVQPKLDGIRALNDSQFLYTKEGRIHTITSQHLFEATRNLIKDSILDGELYNHKFKVDFNKISSIVRMQNPLIYQLNRAREVLEYHLYDCNISNLSFEERYNILTSLFEHQNNIDKRVKLVETHFIDASDPRLIEKLLDLHIKWIKEGYEGSMIRDADAYYKSTRVRCLLKRKESIEDEFELVDILSGRGNKEGIATSIVCRDSRGEEFSAGILGNESYCIELLKNKQRYIGKQVTVKFQNLTPERKVPRFAKMKAIRDYE